LNSFGLELYSIYFCDYLIALLLATKALSHKGYTKDFQNLIMIKIQNNLTVIPILYLFFRLFGSKMIIPIPNSLDSQDILIRMKLPVSEDALNNDLNCNILLIFPMLLSFAADYLESLGALPLANRMITWGQSN